MIIFITDSFLRFQQAEMDKYFGPQMDLLASEGVHHFEVIWSEDEKIEAAAARLRDVVNRSLTPVTLIGHGKGGLDALDCLVRYPELRSKVQKFVCIQAPVWGTPLADFLTGNPLIRSVVSFVFGNIEVLEEISEMNRQVYMIINRNQIQAVLSEVDVVTVGSSFEWFDKPINMKERVQLYFHRLVQKYAGDNDGFVPLQSMKIGGESHVAVSNVTHLGAVTLENPQELVELTKKILKPLSLRPRGLKSLSFAEQSQVEIS